MNRRLAQLDIVDRMARWVPPLVAQILFGLCCSGVAIIIRTIIDIFAPTAGPFALVYPATLLSTLFGRWRAGIVTYVTMFAWVVAFVLPHGALDPTISSAEVPRLVVNLITVMVVLVFAEMFRAQVRNAADARNAALDALQESEGRFKAIADSIDQMVWSTLPDGFHDYYNQRWYEFTGVPQGSTDGEAWNGMFHPDDQERAWATWRHSLQTGKSYHIEYRLRHRSGDYRWVLGRAEPLRDDSGAITRWYGTCTDIEEIVAAREVLARSSDELKALVAESAAKLVEAQEGLRQAQKMEAIGQLTGGVAHDFNNLLTVIRGSVELLQRSDVSEERRQRYLSAIGETADRASKLTGQLLAFARRQALKPEPFDLASSLEEVMVVVTSLTGSRIVIDTRVSPEPCFVIADRSQFDTAIINLAVNARDAMGGAGRLSITVGPVSGIPEVRGHPPVVGDFVAVTLTDTGGGIASENLDRIFEPFYTTKDVGAGTGLGLSQVIGFAKQSDGEIRVESPPGMGATFILYLPRVDAAAIADATSAQAERPPSGKGVCVLVVEDNAHVGDFAAQALRELSYDSVLTANATDALAALAEHPGKFHVVFSDVVMPGISGLDLAREIRKLYPALPVILTSGYSHVLAQNGQHGFELLHKPYSIEQLSRVLGKSLAWHAHQSEDDQ